MREIITLECPDCKRRNYSSTKNKRNTPDRLGEEVLPLVPQAHAPQGDQIGATGV
jgi:hypothetical protein